MPSTLPKQLTAVLVIVAVASTVVVLNHSTRYTVFPSMVLWIMAVIAVELTRDPRPAKS